MPSVLALDQGTTGSTALVIHQDGSVLGRGYREFTQYFPQLGWVEHDPEEILRVSLGAAADAARDRDAALPAPVEDTPRPATTPTPPSTPTPSAAPTAPSARTAGATETETRAPADEAAPAVPRVRGGGARLPRGAFRRSRRRRRLSDRART